MLPCSLCRCCRAAAQPTVGEPSCHPCHPRSTMRHPCACGLVAVAQLLASVAALDTFMVSSVGHMDSSCNKGRFFTMSGTYLLGFCHLPQGLMITANDSHVTASEGPGCDGTVRKTSHELGACVHAGPGGPMSGSYYKYSIERGESAIKWIYSGANCTGAQW